MKAQITTTRVAIIVLLVLTIALFSVWRRANTQQRRYESVSPGMTEAEVSQLMGKPDKVQTCGPFIQWDSEPKPNDRNTGQCVVQYVYKSPFLILPEQWSVGSDTSHRAVSKYHSTSP
jgi:hypothetical protein